MTEGVRRSRRVVHRPGSRRHGGHRRCCTDRGADDDQDPDRGCPGNHRQIQRAAQAGADVIRVTCDTREAAAALHEIVRESPIPVVADIHYDAPLALLALEAGVHCLRLNPGNITDSAKVADIAREAKARNVPIASGSTPAASPSARS